jgi:hypothetical protein
MATPPTVVLAATLAEGVSASRAFASVTVATGDVCVVSLRGSDGSLVPGASKTAGTSTISAITVPQNLGTTSTDCRNYLGLFTVTAGGTLTITVTGASSWPWDAVLLVATGCAGITSASVAHSSTLVGSLTASANSQVYVSEGDWSANFTSGIAWTPAAAVEDIAQTDGTTHKATPAGNDYSSFLAHWTNVAGGAVSYGRTAPTSANNNIIVWEFLGAASVDPPPGEIRVVSQAIIRASYI